MSSTNKTSLGLNMWEASDKPVRQDFVNDNVIIDEKITKLNSDLQDQIATTNSNLTNYNIRYHVRKVIDISTILNNVADLMEAGYYGGDLVLQGYAPPDTYNSNSWGLIRWVAGSSGIAYLQFVQDRSAAIITRSISRTGNTDTGWILH
jgi:hypothetical protein